MLGFRPRSHREKTSNSKSIGARKTCCSNTSNCWEATKESEENSAKCDAALHAADQIRCNQIANCQFATAGWTCQNCKSCRQSLLRGVLCNLFVAIQRYHPSQISVHVFVLWVKLFLVCDLSILRQFCAIYVASLCTSSAFMNMILVAIWRLVFKRRPLLFPIDPLKSVPPHALHTVTP